MIEIKIENPIKPSPTALVDALAKAAEESKLKGTLEDHFDTRGTLKSGHFKTEKVYSSTSFTLKSSKGLVGGVYFDRGATELSSFSIYSSPLTDNSEEKIYSFLKLVSKYL